MTNLGTYCKAYQLKQMKEFQKWAVADEDLATQTDDETVVYLHDTYVVTSDIFPDRNVIFDDVNAEWRTFCESHLAFLLPEQAADLAKVLPT